MKQGRKLENRKKELGLITDGRILGVCFCDQLV
jgi:hypothetical protein